MPGEPVRHDWVVVVVDLCAGWTVEGQRFGSFAGGLYTRPVRVRHEGQSRGVQFDLEPPAVRALLGVPAGELREQTVSLEDLLGADAARLAECLHDAGDARARFAALDEVLLRRVSQARAARSLMLSARGSCCVPAAQKLGLHACAYGLIARVTPSVS